jgi:hypothetical protein
MSQTTKHRTEAARLTAGRHAAGTRSMPYRSTADRPPWVPRPAHDNPVFQATVAFSIAFGLAFLALKLGAISPVRLLPLGVATVATVAGVLVLVRSVAIRRISQLSASQRILHYEVSCASAYFNHLSEMARLIETANAERMPLNETVYAIIEATNTIVAGTRNETTRLALVRTTSMFTVDYFAGEVLLGIKAGKSCAADRSLDEVLDDIGRPYTRAGVTLHAIPYQLVLFTDTPTAEFDRRLVMSLATLLQMGAEALLEAEVTPMRLRAL